MYKTQTIATIKDSSSKWDNYKVMIDRVCEEDSYCLVTVLEPINAPQGLGYQLGETFSVCFKNLTIGN